MRTEDRMRGTAGQSIRGEVELDGFFECATFCRILLMQLPIHDLGVDSVLQLPLDTIDQKTTGLFSRSNSSDQALLLAHQCYDMTRKSERSQLPFCTFHFIGWPPVRYGLFIGDCLPCTSPREVTPSLLSCELLVPTYVFSK